MNNLFELDFTGCPVSKLPDYEEKVREMFPDLEVLDGQDREGALIGTDDSDFESEESEFIEPINKVPVTILTGFLGSGKTTLLNRILKENHGKKIAVIENEFGAVGVDDQLVKEKTHQEEQIIEVMNGCICCTVRQDLVATILAMKEKYVDTGKIDYILIETTGMADPAPILQSFLINEEVA